MENSAHQGQSGLSFTNKEGYVAAGAFLAAGRASLPATALPFPPLPPAPVRETRCGAHRPPVLQGSVRGTRARVPARVPARAPPPPLTHCGSPWHVTTGNPALSQCQCRSLGVRRLPYRSALSPPPDVLARATECVATPAVVGFCPPLCDTKCGHFNPTNVILL